MILFDEYRCSARLYDLDTQRHVTSRTYEAFCWEGRLRLLEKAGFTLDRMLQDSLTLPAKLTHCAFSREQMPGQELLVRTWLTMNGADMYWLQDVCEPDQKLACRIATVTEMRRNGAIEKFEPEQKIVSDLQTSGAHDPVAFIHGLPASFDSNNGCETAKTEVRALFSERTPFFDYGPATFWRMIEEGRWGFSSCIGLDQKMILELDTVTFFTSGTFRIYRQPVAGEKLTVHTYVDRLEKIRCFLRSDVLDEDGNTVFQNIEEQLIVSLSRRRPKRAGPEFIHLIERFLANPPEEA